MRARRLLGPDRYVTPATRTGHHAAVVVASGWADEAAAPYLPPEAFAADQQSWIAPVVLTDRGWIEIHAHDPLSTLRVYSRSTGLDRRGFRPVVSRGGTLSGRTPTALRFLPRGPLGPSPLRLFVADLQNIHAGDRLEHGDLLLLEIGPPGAEPERYLFSTRDFGWHTRTGSSLLVRFPLSDAVDTSPTPALTLSMAVGYRYRSRRPALEFLGERVRLVGSIGVGSSILQTSGPLDQQLQVAFNALLAGGGIELFEIVSVQLLANAQAPFRNDLDANWTLAAGFDAVQFSRFFANAGARLLRDHPLSEDR